MTSPSSSRQWLVLRLATLLVFATLAVASYFAIKTWGFPHCSELVSAIQGFGWRAPLAFFAVYVLATVGFVPGTIVTLLAGMVFGWWAGTLLVIFGATTGATVAFLLARFLLRRPAEAILGQARWFKALAKGVERNGLSYVLFVRFVPVVPFNALNYACGIVPLRLRDYVVGTFLGMLPGTMAYVYLGQAGCRLIDPFMAGEMSWRDYPQDVMLTLGAVSLVLALLALLPVFLKRTRWARQSGLGFK